MAILHPRLVHFIPGYFLYAQNHPGDTFRGVILFRVTGTNNRGSGHQRPLKSKRRLTKNSKNAERERHATGSHSGART